MSVSTLSFSVCLLLAYKKATDPLKLILCPVTLLNVLIKNFSGGAFGISYVYRTIYKQGSFDYSYLYLSNFLLLSYCSGQYFKNSIKNYREQQAALSCSHLNRVALRFSPVRMMLAMSLLYVAFIVLRHVLLILFLEKKFLRQSLLMYRWMSTMPGFSRIFIMKAFWILSKAFFSFIEMIR